MFRQLREQLPEIDTGVEKEPCTDNHVCWSQVEFSDHCLALYKNQKNPGKIFRVIADKAGDKLFHTLMDKFGKGEKS